MTYLKRGAAGHTRCQPLSSLPAWRKGVPGTSPARVARSGGKRVEVNTGFLPGIAHGQPHTSMEAM